MREGLQSRTMPAQDTALIRNIACIGVAGSGKTALLEAVLAQAGALKAGVVRARRTYLDADAGARATGR